MQRSCSVDSASAQPASTAAPPAASALLFVIQSSTMLVHTMLTGASTWACTPVRLLPCPTLQCRTRLTLFISYVFSVASVASAVALLLHDQSQGKQLWTGAVGVWGCSSWGWACDLGQFSSRATYVPTLLQQGCMPAHELITQRHGNGGLQILLERCAHAM